MRENKIFHRLFKAFELKGRRAKHSKTFCPLPWMHISANSAGEGRVCCEGFEKLRDDGGKTALWKNAANLHSYFNSEDYKKIRLQLLKGERPRHCVHCFHQEDHGVESVRERFVDHYRRETASLIKGTRPDGSIDRPKIFYIDMALGNKCNLKCRMCGPSSSYLIGKDWKKMGIVFDEKRVKEVFRDKWYSSPGSFRLLREALPSVKTLFFTGGEPLLIKEHIQILQMIVDEGQARHIELRYNSNQTVIPKKVTDLWMSFGKVTFNCSVEAFGELNDYIRHPSKWREQEKNIYCLDDISFRSPHIGVYIHTTLQAYNVLRIPEFLSYLRRANFKSLYRFPYFIWVKSPEWCCPGVYPQSFRHEIADKILESVDRHEDFFLYYKKEHSGYSREKMSMLREFAEMIRNDSGQERHFDRFVQETRSYDSLRGESVTRVLPELSRFFPS